jgi:lipopolysaccharide transport system permease protein
MTRQSTAARRLWRYRTLVTGMVARNLKIKYKRSILGFVWTLLNPILTVAVLVSVFTYVVRVPLDHYWAFLLSGYFVWNFLIQTLTAGTFVLAEYAQLSRAVAFPKEVPIIAAALAKLFEFSLELLLVLILLTIFLHGRLPLSFVLVPWLMVLQLAMALGLVFPIAALSVFYHDVQHAVPLLMATLFYLSPVFYAVSLVPESVRPLFMVNPIAGLLTLYHSVIYLGVLPPLTDVLITSAISIALLVIGYAAFTRYEPLLAEVV